MHQCTNCGQEFEGKFCPNCGKKWEEKKVCPNCSATAESQAKFCTECGFSFVQNINSETAVSAVKPQTKATEFSLSAILETVFAVFKYLPFVLFALFAVLLFAFYAAPVAVMPAQEFMGEKIPSESYGNVYSMYSGILGEVPQIKDAMLALIIFAVFALLFAAVEAILKFYPATKNKKINKFLPFCGFAFYFIFFIVGCVVCGQISEADGGMEIFAAGSCPVLLIVFSLLFGIFGGGAYVGRYFIGKKFPDFAERETAKAELALQESEKRKEQYIQTHSAPIEPEKVEKPVKSVADSQIIAEANAVTGYSEKARKLRGFRLAVFHLAMLPLTGLTIFYLLFCIPFGYRSNKTAKLTPYQICGKWQFVLAIILGLFFTAVPVSMLVLYALLEDIKYWLIPVLPLLPFGIALIILGAVGIKRCGALMSSVSHIIPNDEDKMPDYEKRAKRLRGYRIATLHYALIPFTGLTFFYLLFGIPFGYLSKKTKKLTPERVAAKWQFGIAIYSGVLTCLACFGLIIVAFDEMRWDWEYIAQNGFSISVIWIIMSIPFLIYGLIAITLGVVGLIKAKKFLLGKNYFEYKGYKKAVAEYKLNQTLYNHSLDYTKVPAPVKWLWRNKINLSAITAVLLALIIFVSTYVPMVTSNFYVGKVSKIQSGFSREQVTEALGDPYEELSTDNGWVYVSDNYIDLSDQLSENNRKQLEASFDDKEISKLVSEEERLRERLEKLTYKRLTVEFTDNKVSHVMLDTVCSSNMEKREKQVEKIQLFQDNYNVWRESKLRLNSSDKFVAGCERLGNRYERELGNKANAVVAKINYSDGSYQMFDFYYTSFTELNHGIEWRDVYGEYAINVN